MTIEIKHMGGKVLEVKEETRNGVQVAIIKGYLATWDIDRGGDRFVRGAFLKSLAKHREDNRQIRLKDQHYRLIGGFPIDLAFEDDTGLYVVGEINLEVQQGREVYLLAKQGVLSDLSIGYSVGDFTLDNNIRSIHEATIWEGSIVDEPMNPKAKITEVKAIVPYQDLPVADQDHPWDPEGADRRVRAMTESDGEPSSTYRKGFIYYDREEDDQFESYKLQIADVIDDKLTMVPRALIDAVTTFKKSVPESEHEGVTSHINMYYKKMDLPSPFDGAAKHYTKKDIEGMTVRQVEKALLSDDTFSKAAAKCLASSFKVLDVEPPGNDTQSLKALLSGIKSLQESMKDRE